MLVYTLNHALEQNKNKCPQSLTPHPPNLSQCAILCSKRKCLTAITTIAANMTLRLHRYSVFSLPPHVMTIQLQISPALLLSIHYSGHLVREMPASLAPCIAVLIVLTILSIIMVKPREHEYLDQLFHHSLLEIATCCPFHSNEGNTVGIQRVLEPPLASIGRETKLRS